MVLMRNVSQLYWQTKRLLRNMKGWILRMTRYVVFSTEVFGKKKNGMQVKTY